MKNKTLSILAVLMTTMLIVPVFAIGMGPWQGSTISNPHAADAMWVEASPGSSSIITDTGAAPVGTRFNITVALSMNEDVFAWQIGLLYNRTWLKCTKAGFTGAGGGTSMYFSGHTVSAPPPTIDTSFLGNGSILATESCQGSDNVTGPHSGTLIGAEFEIVGAPGKGETLLSAFDITTKYDATTWVKDPTLTKIPTTTSNGSISYAWVAPTTKPFMGIEHDAGFAPVGTYLPNVVPATTWPLEWAGVPPTPGLTAVGAGFNALIYVKQIDPAWGMQSATFTLTWNSTVIDVLGGLANVTIDPAWTFVTDSCVPGTFSFTGNFTGVAGALPNKVLVATLTFTVLIQNSIPPAPGGWTDSSKLTFSDMTIMDHTLLIATATPEQGNVIIDALLTLGLPYLYVDPNPTIIGPAPSLGDVFCISVKVANLTTNWHTVAIQTRLTYNDSLFQLVSVTEGPFMQDPTWNLHPPTFFYSLNQIGGDGIYPITHIILVDLLLPNGSGIYDQTMFPNTVETIGVDPTVATFCFKVLQQNCFGLANITDQFDLLPFWKPSDKTFIDRDASYIPDLPGQNGTVIIASLNFVGRQIDLYGGAVDDGYGVLVGAPYLQFPVPYGGQGPNHYMDIVFPQSWVYLNANVTYNYWPVQNKDVGFEIEGPYIHLENGSYVPDPQNYRILAKFTATTDTNGVASYGFRMPWPCAEDLTGVWKVTSTVTIADQVVNDTMMFYYQHQVYITGVSTDAYAYIHDQCVKVTVTYATHSVETYPALFAVVITDDLGVPFGMALYSTMVGGATFCTWKNDTFTVVICIPKWAYAGNGYVHVSVYDKDPTIGGEAIGPEFTPDPQINIQPY